eukprot:1749-Heterococcus_DN1.PRE.2
MAVNTAALSLTAAGAVAKAQLIRPVMSQISSNSHNKVAIVKGGKVMSQTSSNSHNKVAIVKGGKLASVDVRLHQRQPLAAAAHSAASVLLEAGQPSLIDTDKADADAENEVLFQDILLALQLFRQQHGHLRISGGYIVPSEAPWPQRVQGWRLAWRIYTMKFWHTCALGAQAVQYVSGSSARRDALDAVGFVWGRLQSRFNLLLEALVIYKQLYDTVEVPFIFVVPDEDPWPEARPHKYLQLFVSAELYTAEADLKLGRELSSVRSQGTYVQDHPERWFQLRAMGFQFDVTAAVFEQTRLGLEQYRYALQILQTSSTCSNRVSSAQCRWCVAAAAASASVSCCDAP